MEMDKLKPKQSAFLTARITKRATITKIIILGISIFALR